MMTKIVGYVLTLNEEGNISAVINSLRHVADIIVVVDSFSTDSTVTVAQQYGAVVWQNRFESWASQHNWALDRIAQEFSPEWVLTLDADEHLSDKLVDEVRTIVSATQQAVADVYLVSRLLIFNGRVLRHGGFGAIRLPRFHRISAGRYEDRGSNEHFIANPDAQYGTLEGEIMHDDVMSWESFIAKHNVYSAREAAARFQLKQGDRPPTPLRLAVQHPQLRRRWLRETVFNRLPAKGLMRFLEVYVVRLGFLDGRSGLRMALLVAVQEWFTDLKFKELSGLRTTPKPPLKHR